MNKINVKTSFFKQHIPILEWLPNYKKKWIVSDLIAGISVWALVVPQSLGYASIAGVPVEFGLYAAAISLFLYAIFGTSRHMIQGPSSTVSAVVGAAVLAFTAAGSSESIQIAANITFFAGLFYVLLSILKMGWISNFIARSVLTGFVFGIAIHIIIGQLPKILGIHVEHGSAIPEFFQVLINLPNIHWFSFLLGIVSLGIIFLIRHFLPKIPYALVVFILGIVISWIFNLESFGVEIIGDIPQGLPAVGFPEIKVEYLSTLIPSAIAVVLVGYSESLAAAKIYSEKYRYDLDLNQELFAQGAVNIGSTFLLTIPSSGCIAKSVINDQSGVKTQMASIIQAGLIILTLLFLAPIVKYLPLAVLAAIVIYSVLGLMEVSEMKKLAKSWKGEFWAAFATLIGVLIVGPLVGVVLGVGISILLMVARAARPVIVEVGKNPKGTDYRSIKTHPEYKTIEGLRVVRFGGPLWFATTNAIKKSKPIMDIKADSEDSKPKMVILDMEAVTHVDFEGTETIVKTFKILAELGIEMHLTHVYSDIRVKLEKGGIIDIFGEENIHDNIDDAVAYYKQKFQ